jgi:GGDEF domain-containing protein
VSHTVQASVGGALAEVDDTPETLFARADAALYAAKNAGRNRIELAG